MAAAHAFTVQVIDGDAPVLAALSAAGLVVASVGAWPQTHDCDATLLVVRTAAGLAQLALGRDLTHAAFDSALVVLTAHHDADAEQQLLSAGVEAIADAADLASLPRTIRHAVQRKRVERSARTAYATDLATGLPHQAQLLEHMTQLLALREREPAPMVLLVLRVEGYARAAARLGDEAGNILRRKVAVRIRSGLRASDVVAAIGPDAFGVLLGHVEAQADGERVAAKLVRALQQQPISVSGQAFTVAAAVGLALYPEHGKDAHSLLQRASAQAGSVATLGVQGFGSAVSRGPGAAANDDTP